MSVLPGLLRLPREVRDNIYRTVVAKDQPTDLPLKAGQSDTHTSTTSSLGLLGTCHQLRGEFLGFFVDHRKHTFQDPFVFANEYLVTIGNTHRIQCLRHIELSWPLNQKPCAGCLTATWAPHDHADIPEYTTVASHMRNLALVFKTYPELAENIETISLSFPVTKRFNQTLTVHNEDVFEQVLRFLETVDAQQQKSGRQRRYFMIQTDAAGAGRDSRSTEVLIWAVTKEVWDKLPDGQHVSDLTCRQCQESIHYQPFGSFIHDKQWVHPENCRAYKDQGPLCGGWAHHKSRFPGRNWKFNRHGLDTYCSMAWSVVIQKHKSMTLKRKRT